MKKIIISLITLLMCLSFAGCSKKQEETQSAKEEETAAEEAPVEEEKSEPVDNDAQAKETEDAADKKEFNWYVEIDGVTYGPDEIAKADVDTSIAYIKGVFGEDVKYSLETIGAGWDLFYDLDGVVIDTNFFGNDCDTIAKLRKIWKAGGHITTRVPPAAEDACNFQ